MTSDLATDDWDSGRETPARSQNAPAATDTLIRRTTIFSTLEQSQRAVTRGVEVVAHAAKVTLGPTQRRIMLSTALGPPELTGIGSKIIKQIELSDPLERLGAEMVKEAAARAADLAGDGATTACVLAEAIFKEGLRAIAAGESPIALKRSVDAAVDEVTEWIEQTAVPLSGDLISYLATVSASGDRQIGDFVALATSQLGEYGIITVEQSRTTTSDLQKTVGMQFDRSYLSPYFMTDPEREKCVLEDPYVLVCELSISNMKDCVATIDRDGIGVW